MKKITLYSDGSSRGNPGPGGYGVVLEYGKHTRELSQGFRTTTNNRMELLGVIAALETLKEECEVTVVSDSKYVIDAVKQGWLAGWKNNGWSRGKNQTLKNKDLWQRMDVIIPRHKITWQWVKGHAGHPQNERCDELATIAADSNELDIDQNFEDEQRLLF